jgi:Holliday junction resolvasome RuvABC endonuclease subunit
MMRIIAFDIGRHCAYAWREGGNGRLRWGYFDLEGIRSHRMGQLMKKLPPILGVNRYDVVVYETPFARGRDATRSLWGIAGIIEGCATIANAAVLDVAVSTIKKHACDDGHASKRDMTMAARRFGYLGHNEHEGDAICLLSYAEQNVERPSDTSWRPRITRRN